MTIKVSTPAEIGRLIKAARKAGRLRQDDAAGAIGVSDVFLWKLEKGAPGARLDKVCTVMRELGIELVAKVRPEVEATYEQLRIKAAAGVTLPESTPKIRRQKTA